tara:strand:+ start:72 stop:737 length:666 start_codon:yes stop_codon:yes gene_type:complete
VPKQVTAKQLNRAEKSVGSTTGQRYIHTKCVGCKRASGANQNVQFLKQMRMDLADKGLLEEAPDVTTANDHAIGILNALGIGFVTKAPKSPNPKSPNDNAVLFTARTSLLELETDTTSIPNAKIFDDVSFKKKALEPIFVPINDLYKSPAELGATEQSNIFKPDDNPTDVERRRKIKNGKQEEPNVIKLADRIQAQQKRLSRSSTRLVMPVFKITFRQQGE